MSIFSSICGLILAAIYLTFKVDDDVSQYLSSYQRRYLRILMALLFICTICAVIGVLNLALAYFYINMPINVCYSPYSTGGPIDGGVLTTLACFIVSLYLVNGQHFCLLLQSIYEYNFLLAIQQQLKLVDREKKEPELFE